MSSEITVNGFVLILSMISFLACGFALGMILSTRNLLSHEKNQREVVMDIILTNLDLINKRMKNDMIK